MEQGTAEETGRAPAESRPEGSGGFTLIDGAALVTGAAVASVHIRGVVDQGLPGGGWVILWATFGGVAITAAGPFMFLGRRFGRRTAGYPRMGDVLWAILGIPWVLAAILRTATPASGPKPGDVVAASLSFGLVIASLVALAVVWSRWVLLPVEEVASGPATPWTNRLGLVLSVAWPLQCGFGLIVIS